MGGVQSAASTLELETENEFDIKVSDLKSERKSLWISQSCIPNKLITKPVVTTDGKILAFLDSYISPGLWSFDYKTNEWAQILQTSPSSVPPVYVTFDLDSRYLYHL